MKKPPKGLKILHATKSFINSLPPFLFWKAAGIEEGD